jgi:hypothetical protein
VKGSGENAISRRKRDVHIGVAFVRGSNRHRP